MAVVYRSRPKRVTCSRCKQPRAASSTYCKYHRNEAVKAWRNGNTLKALKARITELEAELAQVRKGYSESIEARGPKL